MQKLKDLGFPIPFITTVVTLMMAGALLTAFGNFPWASQMDVDQLEAKYDTVIELKNQDNQWYRELEVKVGKIETNVENIKASVKRIEDRVLGN